MKNILIVDLLVKLYITTTSVFQIVYLKEPATTETPIDAYILTILIKNPFC